MYGKTLDESINGRRKRPKYQVQSFANGLRDTFNNELPDAAVSLMRELGQVPPNTTGISPVYSGRPARPGDVIVKVAQFIIGDKIRVSASLCYYCQPIANQLHPGQSYDGASVMSGWLNGVQKLIRHKCPMAVFTNCLSHRLNLAMEASIQSVDCSILLLDDK
eukprot:sb/3472655/